MIIDCFINCMCSGGSQMHATARMKVLVQKHVIDCIMPGVSVCMTRIMKSGKPTCHPSENPLSPCFGQSLWSKAVFCILRERASYSSRSHVHVFIGNCYILKSLPNAHCSLMQVLQCLVNGRQCIKHSDSCTHKRLTDLKQALFYCCTARV